MHLTNAIRSMFDRFKPLRQQHFGKQKAVYLQAGISKNHYSAIETKACNCSLEMFLKICIHLRVAPWQLMEVALKDVWDEVCERELRK